MNPLLMVLAFCLVALFVYVARYSGRLRVVHTRFIAAPPEVVFAHVVDLQRWRLWNPWLEHQPQAPLDISQPADRPGSTCAWDDARSGSGQVRQRALQPPASLTQQMRLRHPFRFRGRGDWRFTPRHGGTEVTWSLRGRVSFATRAFTPTVQAAIGLDFRYGLDRLAALLEAEPLPRYAIEYLGVQETAAQRYAYVTHDGPLDELAATVRSVATALQTELAAAGVVPTGAPMAVYLKTRMRQRTTVCRIGIPVAEGAGFTLSVGELPAQRAYVVRLRGSRSGIEVAWYQALQRLRVEGIVPDSRQMPFERYLADADAAHPHAELTELHLPVQPAQVARPAALRAA